MLVGYIGRTLCSLRWRGLEDNESSEVGESSPDVADQVGKTLSLAFQTLNTCTWRTLSIFAKNRTSNPSMLFKVQAKLNPTKSV
eukprot:790333-Amphidinium_carterae.1